jgi:hypothetical protein
MSTASQLPANNQNVMQRAFKEFWRLYVAPEIERRRAARGSDGRAVGPVAAQIIFYPDGRPPVVRLDGEVAAEFVVTVRNPRPRAVGDALSMDEIDSIDDIRLSDTEDPDCAHVTMLRRGVTWYMRFNFHYNRGLARKHLTIAREFLACAAGARRRKHWAAYLDNLFSAAELSARAELLHAPDPAFRAKATHKGIQARYCGWARLGNTAPEYATALNRLASLRERYRYLRETNALAAADARTLSRTVKQMVEGSESRIGR